ncbi:MAG: hypothetical protein LBL74_08660 [Bacteroidales bacterium]|nr:hypothetical protein [Bacteroidales bacterium]
MEENIKTVIEHAPLSTYQVAVISVIVSVITFFITNYIKNYFEKRLLKSKLETEHRFNQQKQIKEVLAKNKVHLLTACEDFNHRMLNFASNYNKRWHYISNNDFTEPRNYYFHSFVYRFLAVFAWIKIIQNEMIFLDTTIASTKDLEFVKFIRVCPEILCDLDRIIGNKEDGRYAIDHFFRNDFNQYSDCIIIGNRIKTYSEYIDNLSNTQKELNNLYQWFSGISPNEKRNRWDRLHLFHLVITIFLNNYGYDFQITDKDKIRQIMTNPKKSEYLDDFFNLLKNYKLGKNAKVRQMIKISESIQNENK